ncbi:MAG: hypothetical protein WAL22_00315 [Solirubrobacteraceae bacterium]
MYAFSDPATYARTAFIEAPQRAGVTITANPVAANPAKLLLRPYGGRSDRVMR